MIAYVKPRQWLFCSIREDDVVLGRMNKSYGLRTYAYGLSVLTRSRIESGKRYGNIHENVYQYGYGEPQKKVEIDAE